MNLPPRGPDPPSPGPIAHVTMVVRTYDEAIEYFTEKIGFELLEDTDLGSDKRFVRVGPRGGGTALLLAEARGGRQRAAIGNQTGGRVGFFLYTEDFQRDHQRMLRREVAFVEEPRQESYGTVAVFEDIFGNLWDLVQPSG